MSEEYSGFDLTLYNLFTLLREMYYTRGETETNFLLKSGGTVAGSLTIQGNLVVNGQSYTIDTENLKVGDYTITLAKDNEQTLTSMVGMVVPKYDGTNYGFFGWDADGYAYVGDLTNYDGTSAITLANNSSLQRISTIDTTNTVVASNGVIYVYDATSHCFKKPTNDNKYYVIRNGAFVETELFTTQKSKNIDNALYNVGAFDTISGNTITRKTKYFVLTGNENWTWSNSASMWYATINGLVDGKDLVCSNGIVAVCYSDNQIRVYASSNPTITSSSNLNEIFKNGTRLEQELSSAYQYPESIIENQPLLNLDQNGANWLRDEYEKGLNLWSIGVEPQAYSGDQYFLGNGFVEVKPNTTYTITLNPTKSIEIFYYNSSKTFLSSSQSTDANVIFTTPSDCYYINLNYTRNGSDVTSAMLNKGTHAYPYQEYNGAIVHKADIEPVLLWENSSPSNAYISGTETLNQNATNFKYLIVKFKDSKDLSIIRSQKFDSGNITINLTTNIYYNTIYYICSRQLSISNGTTLTISQCDCYKNGNYDTESYFVIPFKIYGTNVL